MPRRKGSGNKFQYADPQVFTYQTLERPLPKDTITSPIQNPVFPNSPVLFTNRFANTRPQPEASYAPHETVFAPLERRTTDEGQQFSPNSRAFLLTCN